MMEDELQTYAEVLEKNSEYIQKNLLKFLNVWRSMGLAENVRHDRVSTLFGIIHEDINELLSAENKCFHDLQKQVKENAKKISDLCRDLLLPLKQVPDDLPLVVLEKKQHNLIKQLMAEINERVNQLRRLAEEDRGICSLLDERPFHVQEGIPSNEDLIELENHYAQMEKLRNERHRILSEKRSEIVRLMEDLEKDPESEFELMVVNNTDDFKLTAKNMKSLESLLKQLQSMWETIELTWSELMDDIKVLWQRLDIQMTEQEDFEQKTTKKTHRTILILKEELVRLKGLKAQNLHQFIDKTKDDITIWWDKCFYSEHQRMALSAFYSEEPSEDMLAELETCLESLKKEYFDAENLLNSASKWLETFHSITEFEKSSNDASSTDRYNDRGGRLNRILQQHNRNKKLLPTIEKELKYTIDAWEKRNERTFYLQGMTFEDFVKSKKTLWEEEKENMKRTKQESRANQTKREMAFGSQSAKRPCGQTPTPVKKKTARVDRQLTSTFNNAQPSSRSRMTDTKRIAMERRRSRSFNRTNSMKTTQATHSSVSSAGSYTDFKFGLGH